MEKIKTITIKIASTEAEIHAVEKLFLEYSEWCRQQFISHGILSKDAPELSSFNKERLPGIYKFPDGFLVLAFHKEIPMACMFLRRLSEDTCELKRFYIKPEGRGNGLAIRMLDFLCKEARKLNYSYLRISSHTFMGKAVDIYKKYGFYPIPNYLKDRLQAGSIQMELALNPEVTSRIGWGVKGLL